MVPAESSTATAIPQERSPKELLPEVKARSAPESQRTAWLRGDKAGRMNAASALGLTMMLVNLPVTDLERLKTDERDESGRRIREAQIGSGPHVAAGSPAQPRARIRGQCRTKRARSRRTPG